MSFDMILMEEKQEAREEGREEGSRSAKFESAINFLRMGLSREQVAQGTGLTIEEVSAIKL